jgi:hypothetical protein
VTALGVNRQRRRPPPRLLRDCHGHPGAGADSPAMRGKRDLLTIASVDFIPFGPAIPMGT